MEWVKITAIVANPKGETKSLDHPPYQGQDHGLEANLEGGRIAHKRVFG